MRSFPLRLIPILEYILQAAWACGKHTLEVNRDRNNLQTSGSGSLDSIHVCKFLAQYTLPLSNPIPLLTPSITQRLDCLRKAVRASICKDDFWSIKIRYVGVQVLASQLSQECVKWGITLRRAVLECGCKIDLLKGVCQPGQMRNSQMG